MFVGIECIDRTVWWEAGFGGGDGRAGEVGEGGLEGLGHAGRGGAFAGLGGDFHPALAVRGEDQWHIEVVWGARREEGGVGGWWEVSVMGG